MEGKTFKRMVSALPLQLWGTEQKAQGGGRLALGGEYNEVSGHTPLFQEGLEDAEGVMVPTAPAPSARRPFTCSVGHLHTLLNLAVLFLAQPGDPPGQHAPMWPDELTEQQNILVETEDRRG